MPYLNWKTKPVRVATSTHPDYQSQLDLGLSSDLAQELSTELTQTFSAGGDELKLELPNGWTLYFKQRIGAGRMQLAHPQTNQWVATLNLTPAHGLALATQLGALSSGAAPASTETLQRFVVSRLGQLAPIINFELTIALAS